MVGDTLNRPSPTVRYISTLILTAQAFALIGLYVFVILFGNGIGPEEPGTPTVSTFGLAAVATIIYLPIIAMFFLTAVAAFRRPARTWQRKSMLVAMVVIILINVTLLGISIAGGLPIWAITFGCFSGFLIAYFVQSITRRGDIY